MYSKTAWRGYQEPVIMTSFVKDLAKIPSDSSALVSLAVFEWEDRNLLGIWNKDNIVCGMIPIKKQEAYTKVANIYMR